MTRDTVLAVIRHKGVFQINPLSYRSADTMKLLKKMVAEGTLIANRAAVNRINYTKAKP